MIRHSAVIDNFFDQPDSIRKTIIETPMQDHKASDGVTYPGIVELSDDMQKHIRFLFSDLFDSYFNPRLMFARHSYETMNPPHWAHSDRNMCQYVGLIYLSPIDYPWDGTHLVRHKATGLEIHPENDEQIQTVLRDGNDKKRWEITQTYPSRYNRLVILNAGYLHAAAYKFGSNRVNSRLVLSVFFDLH